jgi:hypothetical protein
VNREPRVRYNVFNLSICTYLINRKSQVSISKTFPSPFVMLSGISQGSVLGTVLFNTFTNDLCNAINHSSYLLFADIRIFRTIKSAHDCSLLQPDTNSVQGSCTANFMTLNISKTKVISFSRKTNTLILHYALCWILVNCISGGCSDHQNLERMRDFLSTPSYSMLLLSC